MEDPAPTTAADAKVGAANAAADTALRAWDEAIKAIEAIDDLDAAWVVSHELSVTARDTANRLQASTGQLRARLAARIREERSLSLAGLAAYAGVSKARAQIWDNQVKRTAGVPTSREDQ
jgi:D-serine deaminase-like pyridoxal phosphate-dependent protein